jgi:hypothetical protein
VQLGRLRHSAALSEITDEQLLLAISNAQSNRMGAKMSSEPPAAAQHVAALQILTLQPLEGAACLRELFIAEEVCAERSSTAERGQRLHCCGHCRRRTSANGA